MTLGEHLRDARRTLERAGIAPDEATVDADVLGRHALGGWDRSRLLVQLRDEPPPDFAPAFAALVERRARREPAAYITGRREFWGLEIAVTPDTLIPRPETEGLVEAALARVTTGRPRLADVCTGSGCLAVALAHHLPGARVVATDLSPAALAVARRNASTHGVDARVACVRTSLLAGLAGPFDLVVSNPPYVPTADVERASPEVRVFEPHLALDGGADGLAVLRRLVPAAALRLVRGGWLIVEFGAGQADAVRAMMANEPSLVLEQVLNDLAGLPRVAVARTRGSVHA